MELFEKICENKKNSPNFVASILCSSITNLERQGLDATLLKPEHIIESFELLASGQIPKEAIEIIFKSFMSGKIKSFQEQTFITEGVLAHGDWEHELDELEEILDKIIQNNMELVKKLGDKAITTLMGLAMKEVRGRFGGKLVNEILHKKISEL